MKFSVNQQDIRKSLNYCQGVIEKRSTLPILSNILLDASNSKLTITATDLDLIFINEIRDIEIQEEGKTTTTALILYDIIRKLPSGKKINFSFSSENKIELESEKSIFHLNCIGSSEFPITDENFNENQFSIKTKSLLKLLNKCKFSVSNDETRHYLSGIFLHQTQVEGKNFLTAVSTDSHRMSISKVRLNDKIDFESIILPKKTIFQLCSLLEDFEGDVRISNIKSKIKIPIKPTLAVKVPKRGIDTPARTTINKRLTPIEIADFLLLDFFNDLLFISLAEPSSFFVSFGGINCSILFCVYFILFSIFDGDKTELASNIEFTWFKDFLVARAADF